VEPDLTGEVTLIPAPSVKGLIEACEKLEREAV
jgi:hypothetical protein